MVFRNDSYNLYEKQPSRLRLVLKILAVLIVVGAIGLGSAFYVWPHRAHLESMLHHSAKPTTNTTVRTATAPSDGVPTDAKALGFAAGSSLPSLSSSDLNTRLAGMEADGATWVRFDFDWSSIQPDNSTSYNWSQYDAVVAAAKAHHLQVLGIIDFTPAWARAGNCSSMQCPPASAGTYAQFASVLSQRYAPQGVHDWEIWNEPNNPQFWQPGDSPQAYVDILKAAYSSLHATDTHVTVITAGLSPQPDSSTSKSPVAFLSAMYNGGASGNFDAVGDHPYTFPLTPASNADDAWNQMAGPSNSLRSVMVSHGDSNKKIWITEFGAPTGGPGPVATVSNPNLAAGPFVVDQGLQAKILSDAMDKYKSYSWAGPFFYYTYQDPGTDPSTNENFFGLVSASGSQKQAYTVFKQSAASLR